MQTSLKRKPIKRAAILHDLCTVGRAAMTNILPVLSVMGIEACPVPTMVLSSHTGGFGKPYMHALSDFPVGCAAHLKENGFSFEAVFVGYLGNRENIQGAKAFLENFKTELVLFDPIMADHGTYYSNFNLDYQKELLELIPFASLMTPNYTEACFLTGLPYEECFAEETFHELAGRLRRIGARQCVITSIPLGNQSYAIGLLDGETETLFSYKLAGRAYPGTGDLFSAVLLGDLLNGADLLTAAKKAHLFVKSCIEKSDAWGYDTKEGVLLEPELICLL